MPEEMVDEGNPEHGTDAFKPMLLADHPAFDQAIMMDLFDIVTSRHIHSKNHSPTCFKYGSKRKCRFRFPRMLTPRTGFD
jgi:hypothetical protein